MKLIEVNNKRTQKEFILVNVFLNNQNQNYIRPLDNEVSDTFNPEKNKNFTYGDAKRWILKDNNGELIGRIAAFTNSKYINHGTNFKTGGIGFFDCINNQHAANMLFNSAKNWLQNKGMEAMDGPINFGDRDKWWGLLIEGFEQEPMYGMSFNPAYYSYLFEGYGFKSYYNQFYFYMKSKAPLPNRFPERHARFANKPDYTARHIKMKNLKQHAAEFATVYNSAWAQHGENKEVTEEQIYNLFLKMKPIMDERILWFAYYKEEPIAMWINIPDLNQYFKHFNGKMGWWQKLQLLWMKKMETNKKFTGIAFGVVPKYQALGIDSFMIYEGSKIVHSVLPYEDYEMGWAGDWNPKMLNVYRSLPTTQSRKLTTYRFIFDEKYTFERHPEMQYK